MAKNKRGKRLTARKDPPPAHRAGRFTRLLYTLLAIALIVYLGAQLAMRTDGFRSIVEERLTRQLGMPVTIGKLKCDAQLGLVANDLSVGDPAAVQASSLFAQAIQLDWSLARLLGLSSQAPQSLSMTGGDIRFHLTPDGAIEPQALASIGRHLATWSGISTLQPEPETKEGETHSGWYGLPTDAPLHLHLADTTVCLTQPSGEAALIITGINLDLTPLQAPGRSMTHLRLSAEKVERKGQPRAEQLQFEMLDLGSERIVLQLEANWQGGSPADFLWPTPVSLP